MQRTVLKDRFGDVAERRGWLKDDGFLFARKLAEAIGIHESTVSQTLNGNYEVTAGFVGRVLRVTNLRYKDLFEELDFEALVDPGGLLLKAERTERAEAAYREHMARVCRWRPRKGAEAEPVLQQAS